MGRPTNIVRLTRQLDTELGKSLRASSVRNIRKALLAFLLTGTPSEYLLELCQKRRGLIRVLRELEARVQSDFAICKAVHEAMEHGASDHVATSRHAVSRDDLRMLRQLSEQSGMTLEAAYLRHVLQTEEEFPWRAAVAQERESVEVVMSDGALDMLLFSVLEAFVVPGGRGRGFTEVYGWCWGTQREVIDSGRRDGLHGERRVHVERIMPQTRARALPSAVYPDPRSHRLHLDLGEALFRHYEVVGEFHSHPYRSLQDLRDARGWEHSFEDDDSTRQWVRDLREENHSPVMSLVAAVAQGEKESWIGSRYLKGHRNVVEFGVGRIRVYLATWRILPDGACTGKGIELIQPSLTGRG